MIRYKARHAMPWCIDMLLSVQQFLLYMKLPYYKRAKLACKNKGRKP